jgi:hypothetical protein
LLLKSKYFLWVSKLTLLTSDSGTEELYIDLDPQTTGLRPSPYTQRQAAISGLRNEKKPLSSC